MDATKSSAALRSWLSSVTRRQLRLVESLQPATLPSGRRLRGVRLAEGLYLGRNKQLYVAPPDHGRPPVHVLPATDEAVCRLYVESEIRNAYATALAMGRGRRHGSCLSKV